LKHDAAATIDETGRSSAEEPETPVGDSGSELEGDIPVTEIGTS
jgi:hypothetical protein